LRLQFAPALADSPRVLAHVEKIRLREISLVPNPVNAKARVLKREPPSPMSSYIATGLRHFDLSIAGIKLIQKQLQLIEERAQ
jgi:hypothetical protein